MSLSKLLYYRYKLGMQDAFKLYGRVRSGKATTLKLSALKHPFHLRALGEDFLVFDEIFVRDTYAIPWKNTVIETVIDAGANIGCASVYFANKFPDASIVAIEPDDQNFAMLQKNTGYYKNITSLQKGLWNEPAYLKLVAARSAIELQVEPTDNKDESICESVSVNWILSHMQWQQIDLIKMDIQGAEANVFSSNTEWLGKTKLIIIELHENHVKNSSQIVMKRLTEYGFRFFTYHNLLYCLRDGS